MDKQEKMAVAAEQEKMFSDKIGGLVDLSRYENTDLNLADWELTSVIDDVLMVKYADATEDGKEINRGGIFIPVNVVQNAWRVGEVMLAGPKTSVKPGDFVVFPNDRGMKASNINGIRNVVFLNQERIFGVCKKK
jgi:hypothetical protein